MGIVEQAQGENSIGGRGLKRQKVVKRPMAKAIPATEKSKGVRRIEEPAPAIRGLEEAGGLEKTRRLEETGGSEEIRRPEEAREPGE